jgi:hypothetical protein
VTLKTHPVKSRVVLKGARQNQRKRGYAEWQLQEEN